MYSSENNSVRRVTLRPDRSWGGAGMLGGDIGYGELNELPEWDQVKPVEEKKGKTPVGPAAAEQDKKSEIKEASGKAEASKSETAGVVEDEILLGKKEGEEKAVEVKKEEAKSAEQKPNN